MRRERQRKRERDREREREKKGREETGTEEEIFADLRDERGICLRV